VGGGRQQLESLSWDRLYLGLRVDCLYLLELFEETASKVTRVAVVGAKLKFQRGPWDDHGFAQTVEPVGEPAVDIHGKRGAAQGVERPHVDWDRMSDELLVELT